VEQLCKAVRPQMTIWRMRIACWIPKATNTHSQYVIVIAFPLQQRLEESATSLCSTYIAHHQAHSVLQVCASCRLLFLSKQTTCSPQMSPTGDAVPIFPSFCICRHKSRHSLFCVFFLHVHVVMRRATAMYIHSQC